MIAPLYYNPTLRGDDSDCGCGCGGSCHQHGLGYIGFLGDSTITPQQAIQQAIQESSGLRLNPRDFQNSSFLASEASQIAAGQVDLHAYSSSCTQQAPNVNMFQTASGLALGTTAAGVGILGPSGAAVIPASAVPVVGWVVAGVGAIVGLISAIFNHHAAAERRDLNFGCSAIPAVNNALSVISRAVQSGQINPDEAASALDHIDSEYQSAGSGGAINNSPWCNSNCEIGVLIKGIIIYQKSQYQAIAAQKAAAEAAAQQATEQQAAAQQAAEEQAAAAQEAAQQAAAAAAAAQSVPTSLPATVSPVTGNVSHVETGPMVTVDPATGHTVLVHPSGSGSWFTEKTIISSVPNWAVLVGAAAALEFAGVL